MSNQAENKNPLELSDEDFLKLGDPSALAGEAPGETLEPSAGAGDEGAEATATTDGDPVDAGGADDTGAAGDPAGDASPLGSKTDDTGGEPNQEGQGGEGQEGAAKTAPAQGDAAAQAPASGAKAEPGKGEPKPGEGQGGEAAPADKPVPVDYQAFYNSVIGKPIKANGKEITLNNPDEVIRMIQMGAGYGKKMNEIAPHLKTLRMLEKNGLTDENQIGFLIDLHQKNPEAIKKLIKDSGIDPLDLNMSDNANWTPGKHRVSDQEMRFQEVLTDVQSDEVGKETVRVINTTWDQESKSVLWESPELMGVIKTQRENGIYAMIVAEVDRQKTLGHISQNIPFLKAYQEVGNQLQAAGTLVPKEGGQAPNSQNTQPGGVAPQPAPRVLETRAAAPKAPIQNNDKARAASPTQAAPRTAKQVVNPLQMSDDDFLKQFGDRL